MSFDELLKAACEFAGLPNTARIQLPSSLSAETRKMVMKLSPEEFGRVLNEAIEAVNHGSVKSIDILVRENIRGMS